MPRYFLHLHECGTIIADEGGIQLPDLTAAHAEAIKAAREIMCAEVAEGRLCLGCCIIVEDETRMEVDRVPFRKAITLTGV